MVHIQHQDKSIPARHSESSQKSSKDLVPFSSLNSSPTSLLLLPGLESRMLFLFFKPQAVFFFCNCSLSAWRAPEFFAYSGHISNVTSSERCSRIPLWGIQAPPTHILSISFLSFIFFLQYFKKKKKKRFLSPETGFIRLAHITHHWVIKWPEGGELGTWFPVHLLHWKSCVAWSRVSFINWGLGFWHPELSIPTQLPVHSDMTLLVLCVHQHKFTISGYAFQEEKITLLYIPRTYLKDPSILQQETSAVSTPTHFQLFTSKSLPCCVHQL